MHTIAVEDLFMLAGVLVADLGLSMYCFKFVIYFSL